jgi:hypothetical protein
MTLTLKTLRASAAVAAFLSLSASAGAADPPKAALPPAATPKQASGNPTWDQLPATVREVLKRELGTTAAPDKLSAKTDKDGRLEYRASAVVGSKQIEVRVTDSGTVTRKREKEELGAAGLPNPIAAAARRELGKAQIVKAEKRNKDGEVTFTIAAETKDRAIELRLKGDGSFVDKREEQKKPDDRTPAVTTAGAVKK